MGTDLAIRDDRHYLDVVGEIRALVDEIESLPEAKNLADRAAAAQTWAQRAQLGEEQINLAIVAKLWAERRAGELLASSGFGTRGGDRRSTESSRQPRLESLGVSKDQSSDWQKLAAIPVDDFDAAIDHVAAEGRLSRAKVMRTANQEYSYVSSPPEALHDTRREIKTLWDRATVFNQYDVRENLRKMPTAERDELVERLLEAKEALDKLVTQMLSVRNERPLLKIADKGGMRNE